MRLFTVLILLVILTGCSAGGTDRTTSGFDEYGYNEVAGIFNGIADGVDRNFDGLVNGGNALYANDQLVMKWNSEWDRGNDEGWSNPPYYAWENNQWNGQVEGGSGEIWHYKIKWIGPQDDGTPWTYGTPTGDGGYAIWGQFEVLMSQGTAGEHFWDCHAIATGYGGPH